MASLSVVTVWLASLLACLLRNYLDGGNLIHFLANEFQSDCTPMGESF